MSHPITMFDLRIDPETNEWVFPDGIRQPLIAGGSAMADDEIEVDDPTRNPDPDDDDGDDDRQLRDDDDDDPRDRDDDWTPPDKQSWEKLRSAIKNLRRENKMIKREYEDRVQNLTSTASATNEVEVEKARISAVRERDAYWTEEIVRARGAAEFAAQGASAEMAERLAGLIKLKNVEWDEKDREWEGLQDEIDDIVEANPEFFKPKGRDDDTASTRTRAGLPGRPRVDGASRGGQGGGAPRRKPSSAQILANQALGTPRGGRRRG